MKNKTYLKLGIAAVCTFTTIATIRSQDGPPPSGGPGGPGERGGPGGPGGDGRGGPGRRNPFLSVFDANGDGTIDEKEMINATAALKKLDKDGDGKVTDDELRAAMPGRGPGGPGGQGGPGGPGGGGSNNVPQLVNDLLKFDANGDGKISKEELPDRMKSLMDRGDTDKDSFLSKDEIQKLFQSQNNAGNRGDSNDDHDR
ncbi:MAG: hypothetical protein QOD99_1557 [Chthoniobacter sp.]|jgi:Ca2+-binding EF-hand superfamily protein|nr:hypothetical protein [Chthoniobacter sp.]